ncbi:hypothetical protein FRX31_003245, partial [Thalictrum thalictroides]
LGSLKAEFSSLALDISGLCVFNYDFGSVTKESPVIKMSIENLRDRKRKIAAVAGAIATTVGCIASLCVGMEATSRKSYIIHNDNRQDYLDGIYNGLDSECHHLLRMNK